VKPRQCTKFAIFITDLQIYRLTPRLKSLPTLLFWS
jgi:hypothetical protein